MRKTKGIVLAAALLITGIIQTAAGIKAGGNKQQETEPQIWQQATWQVEAQARPLQQIEPEPQEKQQYIPSTEAEAGYISEAELMAICSEVGGIYDICPELMQALVEHESSGRIEAYNAGCCGLAQVSTRWHADRMERLGITDIYEPYGNILVAADFLRELFNEREDGDVYYVLMRYNMAIDTANELYDAGQITDYAISITDRAAELERLHGK